MKQLLLLVITIAFSQITLANTITGTWEGDVTHNIKGQFAEKKLSTVQITQSNNGTVEIFEGFFGDRVTLILKDGKLYKDNVQVGMLGENFISFYTFLFHDTNNKTNCYVHVSSFVNENSQLDYFNQLKCDNGYYDTLSGALEMIQ